MKIYQLTQLQLRFVIQNKDLKSKIRRINLKWILLNQLKWILDELFRVLCKQYKPMQLYLRAGFSSPTQASFFLICAGDSTIENEKKNEWMKKWKKYLEVSGDVIILHICTKNHNHIMYGSWDIRHDRQSFFVILGYFLLFYP